MGVDFLEDVGAIGWRGFADLRGGQGRGALGSEGLVQLAVQGGFRPQGWQLQAAAEVELALMRWSGSWQDVLHLANIDIGATRIAVCFGAANFYRKQDELGRQRQRREQGPTGRRIGEALYSLEVCGMVFGDGTDDGAQATHCGDSAARSGMDLYGVSLWGIMRDDCGDGFVM